MAEVRLSRAARTDLTDIWLTTAQGWGEAQADRYLDDLDRSLRMLADTPGLGADCSDLLRGARRLPAGRHMIYYDATDTGIFVIRVLHQSMDAQARLGPA